MPTDSVRFWSHVDKSESCWNWAGAIHRQSGLGQFRINGNKTTVARIAYELCVGALRPGETVEQTCGNRLCVRPEHLRARLGRAGHVARHNVCKRGHNQEGLRSGTSCLECRRIKRKELSDARPKGDVPELPVDILTELKALHDLASQTRGATPIGHEYRSAGDRLASLAVQSMSQYGVDATKLSRQMGLSENAMRQFLMRRGAIPTTPSFERHCKPYKNGS